MSPFFHGAGRRGPYFEGWYLKYQTADGVAIALIPALHTDASGARSASLQVITRGGAWQLNYPADAFHASRDAFSIRLGGNAFTKHGAVLDIHQCGLDLSGAIEHGPFTPPTSDIMGPFRFLPGMECVHGVLSMGHPLRGQLTLNGAPLRFGGGTGYIETDRGRSFPEAYLWTQCTWTDRGPVSLMLSIAAIPFLVSRITGCICAIHRNGREYRLATYRGARIEHWSGEGAALRQGPYRLQVDVLEAHGHPLRAPVLGSMTRTIHESLDACVRYRLWKDGALLLDHTDSSAGFEFSGSTESAQN